MLLLRLEWQVLPLRNLLFIQAAIIDSIIQSVKSAKSTMNGKSEHDLTKEILLLKKKINITSLQLENFLQYLDQNVFKRTFSFCGPARVTDTPEFMRAFGQLSSIEKADYYLCALKLVQEISKRDEVALEAHEKLDYQISYRLNSSKEWVPTVITIDSVAKTLYFNSTNECVKIQNYIIRYSKCKDRNAFALECSIGKSFYETIRISHGNFLIFQQLQEKVRNIVVVCLRQRIFGIMNGSRRVIQLPIKNKLVKRQSISVAVLKGRQRKSLKDLIQQSTANLHFTIDDYNAISGTLVDQSIVSNMDNFDSFQEITKDTYIHIRQHKVKKVYRFNEAIINKEWLIDQLTKYQNFKIWKSALFMVSLLASIPSEKSLIFHQIDMYKDSTECDYVFLRHYFTRGQKVYFIDKSISTVEYGSHETSKSRGNIEYCIWRIQTLPNKVLQVIVQCEISHVDCTDIYDIICEQIGQLQKIILCKSSKSQWKPIATSMDFKDNQLQAISCDDLNQFTSYEGVSDRQRVESSQEPIFFSIYTEENQPDSSSNSEEIWQFEEKDMKKEIKNRYRYTVSPDKYAPKIYKTFKNGLFFDDSECVINQHGQLLFVNQQKIKAQSNVLKNVLKRIGTNFFSGKSILNVSLPIEIFSADTNLQRLCRANAYAPLFLENKIKAEPIQRIKAVIAYSIGTLLLYINMAKPFNPVLGETYQAFIDGCPLYGEQISHHPPISSLLLIGRGYFIHANLEAKVQFGLNNVSGINEGLYKIAFHQNNSKQNVISFFSPPGQLSGVIFGQRKLSLINKTRYFDEKSQIFCQITWGRNKKQHQSNYSDYMQGQIVSLHKPQTDIYKIKPSKQDKVLGKISGRWTQKIYFNDEIIFDINQDHPYQVIEEANPLQSDSKFRKDRLLMEQNMMAGAQQSKEQIEQIQRRDRKLRKQYQQ